MGILVASLLLTASLILALCYMLYTPIPAGFSQPLKVHVLYSLTKFVKILAEVGEVLGMGSRTALLRELSSSVNSRQTQKNNANDVNLVITDTHFDDVPVRVYTPKGNLTHLPGLLFFHGGGGILGSVRAYDGFTRRLATSLNAVVVSVEYRLAPEHIFPAAFDDCVTATMYFVKHASNFGVDSNRIGVAGDSTGGNLAATTALKLRDDGLSLPLKLQVLLYPMVQAVDLLTPSYKQNAQDAMSGASDMALFRPSYFQGHTKNGAAMIRNLHTSPGLKAKLASTHLNISALPEDMIHADYVPEPTDVGDPKVYNELESILLKPYACPLLADDLSNLPMAYVFTGHNDVLRDEGIWYVQRLMEAGVLVKHRHSEIAFHGIFSYHSILPEASAYTEEVIDFVKDNL